MQNDHKPICLAVLQQVDNRYAAGYRPESFTNKKAFVDFVDRYHGLIFSDEILVILSGGSYQILTIEAARKMEWILEAA